MSGKKTKEEVGPLKPTPQVISEFTTKRRVTMSKSTDFSGQPFLNQLIMFLEKWKIRKIAMQNKSDRYVKKFSAYNHVVVMLFVAPECYHSIREVVLVLLANQ